jgi:hypothetical protein
MGGVMLCDRERDEHRSQKFYATIHSEKMTPHNSFILQTSQQLYVFAMNNKASPPSTNPTKKYSALFPYFPSLEGRLAGEHTVYYVIQRHYRYRNWDTELQCLPLGNNICRVDSTCFLICSSLIPLPCTSNGRETHSFVPSTVHWAHYN